MKRKVVLFSSSSSATLTSASMSSPHSSPADKANLSNSYNSNKYGNKKSQCVTPLDENRFTSEGEDDGGGLSTVRARAVVTPLEELSLHHHSTVRKSVLSTLMAPHDSEDYYDGYRANANSPTDLFSAHKSNRCSSNYSYRISRSVSNNCQNERIRSFMGSEDINTPKNPKNRPFEYNSNSSHNYTSQTFNTLRQRTYFRDLLVTLLPSLGSTANQANNFFRSKNSTASVTTHKDCQEYEITPMESNPPLKHHLVPNEHGDKAQRSPSPSQLPSQSIAQSIDPATIHSYQSQSSPSHGSLLQTMNIESCTATPTSHSHPFQTSSSQKKFLKSIRMYALGIFAVALSATAIVCIFAKDRSSSPSLSLLNLKSNQGHNSNRIMMMMYQSEIDTESNNNGKRRRSASTSKKAIPNVKQPNRNTNHHEKEDESFIRSLRKEFHEWAEHHGRDYGSDEEKEKRFHVWKENHFRTITKNEQHGPCKLTGKAVFGSNHFKDLTSEEFRQKHLTGYTGPKTDELNEHKRRRLRTSDELNKEKYSLPSKKDNPKEYLSSDGLHDPTTLSHRIKRHDSVHERYLKHVQETPKLSKTYYDKQEKANAYVCNCSNYVSYNGNRRGLSKIFKRESPMFGKTYYNRSSKNKICSNNYGKTYYNSNASKSSSTEEQVDCSKYKLQADVDYDEISNRRSSSSSCKWYDMTCWLQKVFGPVYSVAHQESLYNNYNYPSSIDWRKIGAVTSVHSQGSCGACWAITATETIEAVNFISTGVLRDLAETEVIICEDSCQMCDGGWPQNAYDYVEEYGGLPAESSSSYDGSFLMTLTMVTTGESDEMSSNEVESIMESTCPAQQGSSDNGSSATRYGAINGYAYATDRCVCYTDGTGCDCDEQNEELAVMNVASYGPATVCLEANTWQDYTGGIITADSGCTSAFLDMNHCVQVVGYAYTDVSDENAEEGSGSNDGNGNSYREGYWIVRNQWSSYWGMNGYAYVAMGGNTCGILNDMTQVFME